MKISNIYYQYVIQTAYNARNKANNIFFAG